MLPSPIKDCIERRNDCTISNLQQVSGGSINRAAKIDINPFGTCFLKWNTSTDPDLFEKEVRGLKLLRNAGTNIRIPEVVDQYSLDDRTGYLLLEYIEPGSGKSDSATAFGRQLAALHSNRKDRYGLNHDNYIGRLPQSNSWHDDWVEFFISERMEPQLKMALDAGKLSSSIQSSFQAMYHKLPDIFPDEPPALLHGDLWGGNFFYDTDGTATLYDPAVYYGHREIEMAFTYLFGGFSTGFYRSYNEQRPLEKGFDNRKKIYNLYPLLVHTNLFGGHYGNRVASIVRRF